MSIWAGFEAVIFANAIFILYATDYEMQNLHQPVSSDAEKISVAELLLASFYVIELLLKLIVHRFYFFWNAEMAWNWFLANRKYTLDLNLHVFVVMCFFPNVQMNRNKPKPKIS